MALEEPWRAAHLLAKGVQTQTILFHLTELDIQRLRDPGRENGVC